MTDQAVGASALFPDAPRLVLDTTEQVGDQPRPASQPTQDPPDVDAATALQVHLLELATVSLGELGFEEVLVRVADLATRSIPGADGTGLALREPAETFDTLVSTEAFVADVDAVQYRLGVGPCVDAVIENATVWSGSLADDPRWGAFGPMASDLGVESVLSLPLQVADQVIGSLNVYARGRDAFDPAAAKLGEMFAVLAAVAVQNAQTLVQSQRVVEQLHVALVDSAIVDQAVGVLVYRHRVDEKRALNILRDRGRYEQATVQEIAQTVVDDALARGQRKPEVDGWSLRT